MKMSGDDHTPQGSKRKSDGMIIRNDAHSAKRSKSDEDDPAYAVPIQMAACLESPMLPLVEEKFEKYFGYLARCEGKFCTTTLFF